jgi:hypothetical protein
MKAQHTAEGDMSTEPRRATLAVAATAQAYVTGIRKDGKLTVVIDGSPGAPGNGSADRGDVVFSFPLRTSWDSRESVVFA